jgi:hypothetical protein
MEKPTYYAVIPAIVRYDPDLSSSEKLLYAEITALCNATGECFASNNYFAKLYSKDKVTISRWVAKLRDKGYIHINYKYVPGSKAIESRIVHISQSIPGIITPTSKNAKRPTSKNAKDNTIINNNAQILFEAWWNIYNKKVGKKKSLARWMRLTQVEIDKCMEVVEDWVKYKSEIKYRPHPITYLNGEMWEDEIPNQSISKEWKKQEAKDNFEDLFGI